MCSKPNLIFKDLDLDFKVTPLEHHQCRETGDVVTTDKSESGWIYIYIEIWETTFIDQKMWKTTIQS